MKLSLVIWTCFFFTLLGCGVNYSSKKPVGFNGQFQISKPSNNGSNIKDTQGLIAVQFLEQDCITQASIQGSPKHFNREPNMAGNKILKKTTTAKDLNLGFKNKFPQKKTEMSKGLFGIGLILLLFGLASFWFANPFLSIFLCILGGVFIAAGSLGGSEGLGILIGVCIPLLVVIAVLAIL